MGEKFDDIKVLQVVPGSMPTPGKRDNIFIHRQVASLERQGLTMERLYVGLGSRPGDMAKLYFKVRDVIKRFKPHVVHAQYGTVTGLVTVAASGTVPTVVSYGGDEVYGTYKNHYSVRSLRTSLARLCSIASARRANICITKNEEMSAILRSWGANRVIDIPNGIDLGTFRPMDRGDCRRRLGLDEDRHYVLFVSRKGDYVKRLDLAQKAVNLAGEEGCSERPLQLLVIENSAPDQVPFFLNACDVLLLCSNHEGSPNIVKEGLACNRPVVCTDVGDVKQRFRMVNGLFLVEPEPYSIVRGLFAGIRVKQSDGRRFVQELSEEAVAARLIRLYTALAATG